MCARVIDSKDLGFSYSSDEKAFSRQILLEGNNLMEIFKSNIIPKVGARHPDNTALRLISCDCQPVGNLHGKVQAMASLSYSSVYNENTDEDPWNLGAQNVSITFNTETAPFLSGFDLQGNEKQVLNSAGCRITAETSRYIKTISFMFCVKAKSSGDMPVNDYPVINKDAVKVAGFNIKAGVGLLMPMTGNFVTEYDESTGEVKRKYWEIQATIQCNQNGWAKRFLDVGTMALFPDEDNSNLPKPIYQFTPWDSTDENDNAKKQPVFGSIKSVIEAKNRYAKKFSEDEKQKKWDELPYQEVTEPLPLNNGQLYADAMKDPVANPYKEIVLYERMPESWSKWNLPSKRS